VIVDEVGRWNAAQRSLMEYDHVIQALPANRANHPFYVGSLPRFLGAESTSSIPIALTCSLKSWPNPIAIPQQIARSTVPGKCFPKLLGSPFRRGMSRDTEMQNPTPIMR
jgi:hypothetical protein